MEIKEKELTVLDRDADPEFYFTHLSNEKLLEIVKNMEDFEDVSNALTELSNRNFNEIVTQQSFRILKKNLGDQFLQSTVFNLLYDRNKEKALEIMNKRLFDAPVSLLREMMSNMAIDSSQPFGKSLSTELLKLVVKRYSDFTNDEKDSIQEDYEWFKENYTDKLS